VFLEFCPIYHNSDLKIIFYAAHTVEYDHDKMEGRAKPRQLDFELWHQMFLITLYELASCHPPGI